MTYKADYTFKDILRSFVIELPEEEDVARPTDISKTEDTPAAEANNEAAVLINELHSAEEVSENSAPDAVNQSNPQNEDLPVPNATPESPPANEDTHSAPFNDKLGNRLIEAGFLTQSQRYTAVARQRDLHTKGVDTPLGEVIVDCGFCTQEIIERLMNDDIDSTITPKLNVINPTNIGEKMIAAGLITAQQRDTLVELQLHLKTIKGEPVRIGELAVRNKLCSAEQFQTLIDERTQKPVIK